MRTTGSRFTRCFGAKLLRGATGGGRRALPLLGASILAALAVALTPAPASAQSNNCLQDQFKAAGNTQNVNCVANDVSVAAVDPTSVNIYSGGMGGNKCVVGQPFSFTATFKILTTSNAPRSNVGIYFGTGQANAKSGTCTNSIIAPQHACAGAPTVTCGTAQYAELDSGADNCGDTSKTDSSSFGAQTEAVTLELQNVTCPSPSNTVACPAGYGTSSCMLIPTCTSWQTPGSALTCTSPSPSYPYVDAAIPGSPSKCECGLVYVPVQPVEPAVSVAKSCNTTLTTDPGQTTCDAGQQGSRVTYHVSITNTTPAGEGGIVVDQICDNRYGTVYQAGGYSGTACTAGTLGSIVSGSSTCGSLGTIANAGSASCDFQADQGENLSVTDTVTVRGHSALVSSVTFGPTDSNTVTVTSSDAPSTATTTKGLAPGPQSACATLRFSVTVRNTSAADETITVNSVSTPSPLPALTDSYFGDITATHGAANVAGSVRGTTCGIAATSSGAGSLSASPGAGEFPVTLAAGTGAPPTSDGGTYTCHFDGVICGTPGPITTFTAPAGTCSGGVCSAGKTGSACSADADCNVTCAHGLQNLDTVTANLTGDDPSPNADTITQTQHQFTANVCLEQSGSSQ